jgi:hypothetical protein
MGMVSVRYRRIVKMANKPKAKPIFIIILFKNEQTKKISTLKIKKVNKYSLLLSLG